MVNFQHPDNPTSCRCVGFGFMWIELPDPAPGGRRAVVPCGCDLSRRMVSYITHRVTEYRRDKETGVERPIRVDEFGKYGKAPPSMDELVRRHGYKYSQFENKYRRKMRDDKTMEGDEPRRKVKAGLPPSGEVPF